jgi:hypothetical protein
VYSALLSAVQKRTMVKNNGEEFYSDFEEF